VNVWKENILEDLEAEEVEYKLAGEILAGLKRVWRRGRRIYESSRVEEARARRENDKGVCTRIKESSERKWV